MTAVLIRAVVWVCMIAMMLLAIGCVSIQSDIVYTRPLPVLSIKGGTVEIHQVLQVFKAKDRPDFPYRARIIVTLDPVTPAEIEDVFVPIAVPQLFSQNRKELVFDRAPQRFLKNKAAALFHFENLAQDQQITIESRADSLDVLALKYQPNGEYRFVKPRLPSEFSKLSETDRDFALQTCLYAYDRPVLQAERMAAANYYSSRAPTLNQVRSAADELFVICSTSLIPLITDAISTLDRQTSDRLQAYRTSDLFADNPRERTKKIAVAIPGQINKKSGLTDIEIIRQLTASAAEIINARAMIQALRDQPKSSAKSSSQTQPASILSKKADSNNDGRPENLVVYRLPDQTYQVKIVDIDDNVLFLSDPFESAPKSVAMKKDTGSKYPVYVLVFKEASGEGAFLGYDGQIFRWLTSESY